MIIIWIKTITFFTTRLHVSKVFWTKKIVNREVLKVFLSGPSTSKIVNREMNIVNWWMYTAQNPRTNSNIQWKLSIRIWICSVKESHPYHLSFYYLSILWKKIKKIVEQMFENIKIKIKCNRHFSMGLWTESRLCLSIEYPSKKNISS